MQSDPLATWQWRRHCTSQGAPLTTRLSEAPIGTVQQFLAAYSNGSLEAFEPATPELVAELNKLHKADPCGRWHWGTFAAENAFGIANPFQVPRSLLQQFLSDYAAGAFKKFEMATKDMVRQVVVLQKAGASTQWHQYCKALGVGTNDPKRLPADVVQRFITESATLQQLDGMLQSDPAATWQWRQFCTERGVPIKLKLAEHPAAVMEDFLASHSEDTLMTVELAEPEMVSELEELQGRDPCAAWHWGKFAAENAMGILNANQVPADVLRQFLSEYADGVFKPFKPATDSLARKVTELRRDERGQGGEKWHAYCQELGVNIKEPKQLPEDVVERFFEVYKPTGATLATLRKRMQRRGVKQEPKEPQGVSSRMLLHNAVTKRIRRNLRQEDIVFELESDLQPFVATVTLSEDINGPRVSDADVPLGFTGAPSGTAREAMESAAEEALRAMPQSRGVRRRRRQAVEQSEPPEEQVENPRSVLHGMVMARLDRIPNAEDLSYTFDSESSAEFVASVILSGKMKEQDDGSADAPLTFRGAPSPSMKSAMDSAAAEALRALEA